MTNLSVSEKEVRLSLDYSENKKFVLVSEARGETLDSLAEKAFIDYLLSVKKQIRDGGGFEIRLTLRDIFLAGYLASEERKWK
jgi:hypothetical protein